MTKGDQGRGLLAKVARLVGHAGPGAAPQDPPAGEAAPPLDRKTLKMLIERKRRNDQVRRREFDFLREALYRKRALQADQAGTATDATSTWSSVGDGAKAQTIEKIARIEAQMSQHWLHRPGQFDGATASHTIASVPVAGGKLEGGVTAPSHLQARVAHLPIDLVGEDGHEHEGGVATQQRLSLALSDAAVLFAKGDDAGAERSLRALMAQDVTGTTAQNAWLALLDLCYAQGQVTRFEDVAAEFADRFHVPEPRWPAVGQPVAAPMAGATPVAVPSTVWRCPALLERADVDQLQALAQQCAGICWLDWSELVSADVSAAEALLTLVQQWLQKPLVFRFKGGGVLRRRLKASTPSGRRENATVWWELRLALLRLMSRAEEFDLAALDFCVTYGVLPPLWQAPVCACEPAEDLPAAAAAGVSVVPVPQNDGQAAPADWPSVAAAAPQAAEPAADHALSGAWQGDLSPALAALDAALSGHPRDQVFAVDCRQLRRMDFVAASALLQWLLGVLAQGVRVELCEVSRLVAAFFHVVGIDDVVPVRLRQY